ncbi:thiolase family protein [Thermocoleostomius sinensis]|uniref:acetyl-CoA C-acetyltransferase n=1 Tax=Thermocoleostomius sinensis A174 TaxID=2016057 RepID=A0A9E8ZEU4_9CYAN|nr:thiolase family protein [Thermocoleostomius sinensis]WAL62065.1 thiolase family protein [Thermocoleostomius sinensis A174]
MIHQQRQEALIVAARRTPIGRVGRSLRTLPVDALMAPVLQAVLADVGLIPDQVDEVILGNAIGPGGNPARLALLTAGFPVQIPGVTIDRQCGSGLEAINLAARLIQAGAADVIIAGGMESVSTAPWRIEKPQSLYELPRFAHRARFAPDGLGDPEMGVSAETVAQKFGISRDRQDQFALNSHLKAIASIQSGRFQLEIVPVAISSTTVVDRDECPRANLTLERLAKLRSAFVEQGTVTVGNTCPINDGAAAVLMVSQSMFEKLELTQGLRVVDAAAVGVDPTVLGIAPVAAIQALLKRQSHQITLEQIDRVEFNEAFAAQVLASLDALEIPEDKVNVGGGAIALGHPYGASGAILMTRLFTEIVHFSALPILPILPRAPRLGLATLGIAGGLGIATLVERYQAS